MDGCIGMEGSVQVNLCRSGILGSISLLLPLLWLLLLLMILVSFSFAQRAQEPRHRAQWRGPHCRVVFNEGAKRVWEMDGWMGWVSHGGRGAGVGGRSQLSLSHGVTDASRRCASDEWQSVICHRWQKTPIQKSRFNKTLPISH